MPLPFVPIILASKLIPVEVYQRLPGELVVANLEADVCVVVYWICAALFCSAPDALSHLVSAEPISPLANAVMLKNRHAILKWDLTGLNPSVSWDTGHMIGGGIGELVTDKRPAGLEVDTFQRRKEYKGADNLLEAAHGSVLKLSQCSDLIICTISICPTLARATKCQ